MKRRNAIKSIIMACTAPVFIASGLMPVKMLKRESGIYAANDIDIIIYWIDPMDGNKPIILGITDIKRRN